MTFSAGVNGPTSSTLSLFLARRALAWTGLACLFRSGVALGWPMGQNRGWRGRSWAALSSSCCAQPNVKPRQPRCSEWICLTLLDTNCLSVVFLSPDNQLPEQFNRLKREHSFLHTKEHHWLPGCYLLHANATGYYSWCQCHQSCAQRVHGFSCRGVPYISY